MRAKPSNQSAISEITEIAAEARSTKSILSF